MGSGQWDQREWDQDSGIKIVRSGEWDYGSIESGEWDQQCGRSGSGA